jgi:hypothetical protein
MRRRLAAARRERTTWRRRHKDRRIGYWDGYGTHAKLVALQHPWCSSRKGKNIDKGATPRLQWNMSCSRELPGLLSEPATAAVRSDEPLALFWSAGKRTIFSFFSLDIVGTSILRLPHNKIRFQFNSHLFLRAPIFFFL